MQINSEIVFALLNQVDRGLSRSCPFAARFTVQAAVSMVTGEAGDKPFVVSPALSTIVLGLNDCFWSSDSARAEGLRKLAVAQLGTTHELDERRFMAQFLRRLAGGPLQQLVQSVAAIKPACSARELPLMQAGALYAGLVTGASLSDSLSLLNEACRQARVEAAAKGAFSMHCCVRVSTAPDDAFAAYRALEYLEKVGRFLIQAEAALACNQPPDAAMALASVLGNLADGVHTATLVGLTLPETARQAVDGLLGDIAEVLVSILVEMRSVGSGFLALAER